MTTPITVYQAQLISHRKNNPDLAQRMEQVLQLIEYQIRTAAIQGQTQTQIQIDIGPYIQGLENRDRSKLYVWFYNQYPKFSIDPPWRFNDLGSLETPPKTITFSW